MAYEAYMTIEGVKQGKFKGESIRGPHKDKMGVLGFEYEVVSPRDVASGQASGKRQHKPVKIIKEWGAASPQLFQAVTTNEVLKSVLFEFIRTTPEGKEDIHYTIKLTNATVCGHHKFTDKGAKHEETADTHELEEISFTFQKIELESKWGKTMANDDWTAPQ
jgi:type VI secretion system secreted protein Hcp